jgi:signal transduction histidine kinase/CheY-like chemotaxis protein
MGRSLADTPVFEAIQARTEGVTQSPGVDGVERLYAFTPLGRSADAPVAYVIVGVPAETAYAAADDALRTGLTLLVAVGVLTLVLAVLSSEVLIRRPMRALMDTTARLATGDLSARHRGAAGTHELAQLADAFNQLGESLQDRQASTQRAEGALHESNRQLHEALTELQQTQQQVIQQERLRALGQMASGIAHDFNNALAPIVAYTDLLLAEPRKLADLERTRSFLEMIQTAAEDATGVVRRLREFYRQRTSNEHVDAVPLEDLIAQVVSLSQFRWKDQAQARGASITIKTDLQPGPPVAVNAADFREALTNLVFNAVDAMPEGGTLTISSRMGGDAAILEVRDTGLGMTEEVRLRCLEPFFTTKGEYGTGLGLGLVYGIVQRHQGTLEIESAPGAGTAIRLRLPIWSQEEPAVTVPSPAGTAESLRILVVEDEPLVRRALVEYLAVDGHTVETAADGRSGLARFRVGTFDLVLTDRALPEMSGDQVAAAVKRLAPEVPVIMVTGFGDLMNQHDERPVGIDLVVSKPVTLGALRTAIAQVIGLSAASQQRGAAGRP